MVIMTRRMLLRAVDTPRIEEAIRKAEQRTSGEIAVSVSRLFWGDIEKAAWKAFDRLGMTNTTERNGVLIFVIPSRRRFVVLGDSGIHAKVDEGFWTSVAAHLSEHFQKNNFTLGLVHAIEEIGEQLATHFPYNAVRDVNELSNEIDFGPS
jgi:uncharacterized membrane protein